MNLRISKYQKKSECMMISMRWMAASAFAIGSTLAHGLGIDPPPEAPMKDGAGVTLTSGAMYLTQTDLNIGTGTSSLSHTIAADRSFFFGFRDDYDMSFTPHPQVAGRVVSVGHQSQNFAISSDGSFYPRSEDGSEFEEHGDGTATYTMRDGTQVLFLGNGLKKIVHPNGYEVSVSQLAITSNTGLMLKYDYSVDATNADPFYYQSPSSISAINLASEYCDPAAASCTLTKEWPTVAYSWPTTAQKNSHTGTVKITDAGGQETVYTHSPFNIEVANSGLVHNVPVLTGIKSSTSTGSDTVSLQYANVERCYHGSTIIPDCVVLKPAVVDKINIDGAEWLYDYQQPETGNRSQGRSVGPKGSHRVVMAENGGPFPYRFSVESPEGVYATFYQDNPNRVHTITERGKHYEYKYDLRGNIEERNQLDADGNVVFSTTAGYETSCTTSNRKWCNKPNWVKDHNGNQTDYTYHDASGEVKTITQPADQNGIRAQTTYSYDQKYAWFKNSQGTFVQASTAVWLLDEERSCSEGGVNGSGQCLVAGNEVIKRYDYGPDDGRANNLWLRGVEVIADGKTLRTCYQYDDYGNQIAETQPKAGLSSCY